MKALNVGSLVVGIIALILSGVLWIKGQGNGPGNGNTAKDLGVSIIVLERQGTTCVASAKTETSHGNKGKNAHWLVINGCGQVNIKFDDFSGPSGNSSPFSDPTTWNFNDAVGIIKAKVDNGARTGTYSFSLYIDNVKQNDPDIVIDN